MVSYNIRMHPTAKREFDGLTETEQTRLKDALVDVSENRQPTDSQKVKMLEGQRGMFRVRVGRLRAVCMLAKPNLCVVKVGHRQHVYDNIDDVVAQRALG